MKVLIVQTAFIGDVVLATPIIEQLKKFKPKYSIDFLLRKGNESILAGHPFLNTVFIFDKRNNKYRNLYRLIRKIRKERYDYVINIQRFFTTGLITALSGAKVKIGFNKNPLSFLFTQQVPHEISIEKNIHEIDRNLSLLKSIVDVPPCKPKLYPSEADYQKVPTDYPYICIAPSSVWFTKQLPIEKWCQLIEKLPTKYTIHLIGSSQDVATCEEIKQRTNKKELIISAGKLSILESVALINFAKMTFANDSAPMHFASAVNAPVTAIFCSTVPQFGFGPLSDNQTIIESEERLTCRPCNLHGKRNCPEKHFNCSDINFNNMVPKLNFAD